MKPIPAQVIRVVQGRSYAPRIAAPASYYTRFVAFSKRFLLVAIGLVIVVLVWIASTNTGEKGSRIVFSSVPQQEVDNSQPVMLKPHYQGVDARNQPYTVIAEKATQKDADNVSLKAIRADLMQHNGTWVALHAVTGELNLKTKYMQLGGGVTLFMDGGYEFNSESATVDMQRGTLLGEQPVTGQGPPGTLTANGFSANNAQRVIRFNGSVRMIIYR